MKHNKLIAAGLILTIGVFLATGCIGGGQGNKTTGEGGGEKPTKEGIFDPVPKNQLPSDVKWITSCKELQNINKNLDTNYALKNNIDCSNTKNWNDGKGFKPIGGPDNKFTGSLYGQGYKITKLHANRENNRFIGVFGYISSETKITNLGLEEIEITGDNHVGGLIGDSMGNVSHSYVTGEVKGDVYVGGLMGNNYKGKVSNCYAKVTVTAKGPEAGDGDSVGGLIGLAKKGTVSTSYANSTVTGEDQVGGLIGEKNKNSLSNSYATGNVTGENDVGGLVGNDYKWGGVDNSYSTAKVNSYEYSVGGLIGDQKFGSTSSSFWNTETSGVDKGVGKGDSYGVTGLNTSQMKKKSTYTEAGWNFTEIWYMDGYPHLQWEK